VCIPDLVIIKYFGNNTTEIKRIVSTCPDLLPSAVVVELELIHVYRTVSIHLLRKSYDVRQVSMDSWNRGFCSPLFCSVMRGPLYWYVCMKSVNTRNMSNCLKKCNKLNKSHLVGKLLNSISPASSTRCEEETTRLVPQTVHTKATMKTIR